MKKIVLVFALVTLIYSSSIFAQSEPTFDQTMQWIKGKLELSWTNNSSLMTEWIYPSFIYPIANDSCFCKYRFYEKSSDKKLDGLWIDYWIHLKHIGTVNVPNESESKIVLSTYNSQALISVISFDDSIAVYSKELRLEFSKSIEPSRMKSAFENAIKHCGGLKKEAY
jgi:hypothetical protein